MPAKLPLFVDAEQLNAVIGDADVQIIAVDSASDYDRAHIPGALQIAISDFTASAAPVAGLLPDARQLADVFSDAGLRNDAHIVAYDRAGDSQAARLLYTLDVMGHERISLLDGGLSAWHEAGLALESGPPQAGASAFNVEPRAEGIADRGWIEAHLNDPGVAFLDVRSAPEYAGTDVRSARGGHIPRAINLDWNLLKGPDGRLRPRTELLQVISDHDIESEHEIVNYCQSHMRSSYSYLVLKYLGFDKVRGYPGAWSDWGNATDTPISDTLDAS
ncbi:thiosulfate sulfurtransferase [Salinisphaera sp. C84B14]|uniref:sulfurtransferase n=1 Tax=Salinisphaera sp. C84B14 TaxID=1304155 RepID=UPI00333FC9DA